ncbi:MAG: acetyl-CoA carboxylase biotin carboxyl carrier protein [Phycisphaerales bacterium]
MIDIRKLEEMVKLMVSHDLIEIDLRDSEQQVTLRRPGPTAPPMAMSTHAPAANHQPPAASPATAATSEQQQAAAPATDADAGLIAIQSPMVGTFYSQADPDSPPFVSAGDAVSANTVVCLVEAMKIFNEIKADVSGRIERIKAKNGQAVEFGDTLFLVRPD